jgi:GxxExxY protein
MNPNAVSGEVIDAAMKVHSVLGPGLMESTYRACLAHELRVRGLVVQEELVLPVIYDGVRIDLGYRLDLLVEGVVIVELKAVKRLLPIHEAQILSYLRLRDVRIGLLFNFNVVRLRDGIRRFVHRAPDLNRAGSVNRTRQDRRGDTLRAPSRTPR